MKLNSLLLVGVSLLSTTATATSPTEEGECGALGILSPPPGVDPDTVRKCADHPAGRAPRGSLDKAWSRKKRAGDDCWFDSASGCETGDDGTGYCWSACDTGDGIDGNWCWTAWNGGWGEWRTCSNYIDCGFDPDATCGQGGCGSCGCGGCS
ncbi:hypothetical protein BJX99DRAFT_254726 [Aspergillus californicus]